MLNEYKTGSETRFASIETMASGQSAQLQALVGQTTSNQNAITGLQSEVSAGSIKSKLSAELDKIVNLENSQKSLSDTINEVRDDGSTLAGQLVSQISNFIFLPGTVWNEADKLQYKIYKALDKTQSEGGKYYYYYYRQNKWNQTEDPTIAGCTITSAGIINQINSNGSSSTKIKADTIELDGVVSFINSENNKTTIDGSKITAGTIRLVSDDISDFNDNVTTITNTTLATTNIEATNLKVNAANIKNLNVSSIFVSGDSGDTLGSYLEAERTKSIASSEIYYAVHNSPTDSSEIGLEDWVAEYPTNIGVNDYIWQKVITTYSNTSSDTTILCLTRNASNIFIQIESSNGVLLSNSDSESTLTAKAMRNNIDISDQFDDNQFKWVKINDLGYVDSTFNKSGKSITITKDDINKKATFNCELTING